ncbi:MAG: hypothetical protein HWN68_00715 [Desulfobacterales bacterium]|nr:hypothetical protein [Desulfobacterales bacterium]
MAVIFGKYGTAKRKAQIRKNRLKRPARGYCAKERILEKVHKRKKRLEGQRGGS